MKIGSLVDDPPACLNNPTAERHRWRTGPWRMLKLSERRIHKMKLDVIAHSPENLTDGHNLFLNQFVDIPRRSIIVSFGISWFKAYTVQDQLFKGTQD
jgi:hypothetical protein